MPGALPIEVASTDDGGAALSERAPKHFSLRTLMAATTLIAILIGGVIALATFGGNRAIDQGIRETLKPMTYGRDDNAQARGCDSTYS